MNLYTVEHLQFNSTKGVAKKAQKNFTMRAFLAVAQDASQPQRPLNLFISLSTIHTEVHNFYTDIIKRMVRKKFFICQGSVA